MKSKLPDGEEFVEMIEFKGRLYVATKHCVCRLEEGALIPIEISLLPELTASEALFAFCDWLTTRVEVVSIGDRFGRSSQFGAPVIELISAFIKSQELSPPRENWHERVKPYPKESDDGKESDGSVKSE